MKSRGAPRCAARHEPHGSHRTASERRAGAVRNRSEPFGEVRVRFGLGSDAKLRSAAAGFVSRRCGAGRNGGGTAAKPAGAERRFGSEPNANRSEPPLPRPAPQGRTRHGCGVWVGPVPGSPPAARWRCGAGPAVRGCAGRAARLGSAPGQRGSERGCTARLGSALFGSVLFGTGTTRLGTGGTAPQRSAWIGSARLGTARCELHGHTRLGPTRLGSATFGSARGQRGSAPLGLDRLSLVQLSLARFGTGTTRLGTGLHGQPARLRSARFGSLRYGDNAAGKGSTTPHRSAWIASTTARLGAGHPGPATLCSARLGSARLRGWERGSAARHCSVWIESARLGSARVSTARPGERGGWDLGLWGFRGGFGGMGRECRDYGGGWGYGVKWKWEMCRNRRKKG